MNYHFYHFFFKLSCVRGKECIFAAITIMSLYFADRCILATSIRPKLGNQICFQFFTSDRKHSTSRIISGCGFELFFSSFREFVLLISYLLFSIYNDCSNVTNFPFITISFSIFNNFFSNFLFLCFGFVLN